MKYQKLKIPLSVILFHLLTSHSYCQVNKNLLSKLREIKCDSVKIFYFNCKTNIDVAQFGIVNDSMLVDHNQIWAHTVSSISNSLSKTDIENIALILAKADYDKTGSDPLGCYEPRMGIAYFKTGLVVLHVDICLECNRIVLEIFDTNKKIVGYSKQWAVMGYNTRGFFEKLCFNYHLPCCSQPE